MWFARFCDGDSRAGLLGPAVGADDEPRRVRSCVGSGAKGEGASTEDGAGLARLCEPFRWDSASASDGSARFEEDALAALSDGREAEDAIDVAVRPAGTWSASEGRANEDADEGARSGGI